VVTGAWCLPLALQTYLLGLAIGTALRLPGWSAATAGRGLGVLLACAAMVVLLVAPFALAASVGRGYLAAVGVMLGTVFVTQVIAALGYGQYFPWSARDLERRRRPGSAGPEPGRLPPGHRGRCGRRRRHGRLVARRRPDHLTAADRRERKSACRCS
jgi:ABC-2 type transport system permease protein